jgi:hypothetical protein
LITILANTNLITFCLTLHVVFYQEQDRMKKNELLEDSYVLRDLDFCRIVTQNFLLLVREAALTGNMIRRFKTSKRQNRVNR